MRDEVFNKGMAFLTIALPNLDLGAERVMLMRELLDDLPEYGFLKAVKLLAQTLKEVYPNTNLIAHLREAALDDGESGEEAWEVITRQVWGNIDRIEASPRALETYRLMGGWKRFWGINVKDEPFLRNEFLQIFKSLGQKIIAGGKLSPAGTPKERQGAVRIHEGLKPIGMLTKNVLKNQQMSMEDPVE